MFKLSKVLCVFIFVSFCSVLADSHRTNLNYLNSKQKKFLQNFQNQSSNFVNPTTDYKKINPTKYKVVVRNIKNNFILVLPESFDSKWKLYPLEKESNTEKIFETLGKDFIDEQYHFIANDYANAWLIDLDYIRTNFNVLQENGSLSIVAEFHPQRLYYIGLGVSLLTFIGIVLYILYFVIKKVKR